MDSLKGKVLGTMQNKLGRIPACVKIAIKLRNQLDGIIAAHLNDGIDMSLDGELWLINRVAPKAKTFIDVGANVGAWSKCFLSKMSGLRRGIIIEPSPLALARLKDNLKEEIKENIVVIVPAAVCEKSGAMEFYMEESAGETSSLISEHSNPRAQKIFIETTTIDVEVAKSKLGFVDFLKIDAEGYDFQVLRGAENCLIEKSIGVIQFEYNAPWARSSSTLIAALSYLRKHGYSVYLLKQDGLYEFDYNTYREYFHYSNFVAVAPGYLKVYPLSL